METGVRGVKYYKLGKHYKPVAEHNVNSMMKIVWLFYTRPSFKCFNTHYLRGAIGHHPKGGGAAGFIKYLARRGHLIQTDARGRKL